MSARACDKWRTENSTVYIVASALDLLAGFCTVNDSSDASESGLGASIFEFTIQCGFRMCPEFNKNMSRYSKIYRTSY